MDIIFAHHKGGTGKTSTCINVAGWLQKWNYKVLVIDLDPQGNSGTGLGIDRNSIKNSIAEVIVGARQLHEVILLSNSGIHVAPASVDLCEIEDFFSDSPSQMRELCENISDSYGYYDYVLIDAPHHLSNVMTFGILLAKNIVIPVDTGVFSYENLQTFNNYLQKIANMHNVDLDILAVPILQHQHIWPWKKNQIEEVHSWLSSFFKETLNSKPRTINIPYTTEMFDAHKVGLPLSHFAPKNKVARAHKELAKLLTTYV